ncbi:hypothetical protein GCM10009623_22840 [Nocardioides aestuarii]
MLRLVVERYDNQDIADLLTISKRTVETHIAALLRKLDMPDRRTLISVSGPDGFRRRLTSTMRTVRDPAQVRVMSSRLVGRHLGADRAHFHEIDLAGGTFVVHPGYADGQPPIAGRYRLRDFSDATVRTALLTGGTLVVRDAQRELDPETAAAWSSLSVRSAVAALDSRDGVCVSALGVTSARPRDWSSEDVALLEETAERTWTHLDRLRLRLELQVERHRFESLADSLGDLVWRTDTDGCLVYANPAFSQLTGRGRGDTTAGLFSSDLPRDGLAWSGLAQLHRADGSTVELEVHLTPEAAADGTLAGQLGTAHDQDGR